MNITEELKNRVTPSNVMIALTVIASSLYVFVALVSVDKPLTGWNGFHFSSLFLMGWAMAFVLSWPSFSEEDKRNNSGWGALFACGVFYILYAWVIIHKTYEFGLDYSPPQSEIAIVTQSQIDVIEIKLEGLDKRLKGMDDRASRVEDRAGALWNRIYKAEKDIAHTQGKLKAYEELYFSE